MKKKALQYYNLQLLLSKEKTLKQCFCVSVDDVERCCGKALSGLLMLIDVKGLTLLIIDKPSTKTQGQRREG
jgi:hypothetical protein